jgi:lysophospholipase L1-like esterase
MRFAGFFIFITIITGIFFAVSSHSASGKPQESQREKTAEVVKKSQATPFDEKKSLPPTTTPTSTTPKVSEPYYIALGDSYAFGFHLGSFEQEKASNTYTPASFNDGYDSGVYQGLLAKTPTLHEVNFSCPGETIESFINGGCSFHTATTSLHADYPVTVSQYSAVKNFLLTHPGSHTITLDIGANEAINVSLYCKQQPDPGVCFKEKTPGVLAAARDNYRTILDMLQNTSPTSDIVLIKYPIPVSRDGAEELVDGLHGIVDAEASSRHLKIAYIDSLFNADTVCSLTNFCSQPSDFHPNKEGYAAMARMILEICD